MSGVLKKYLPMVIGVIIAFLGVGVGIYFSNSNVNSVNSIIQPAGRSVSFYDYEALKAKLIKVELEKRLLFLHDAERGTYTTPKYPNRFYYTTISGSDVSSQDIGIIKYYDLSVDKKENIDMENFDFVNASDSIYKKTIPHYNEFRIVGFFGDNKLVFFETSNDDSPGPCGNDWLRTNLQYIDIDNAVSTKVESISSAKEAFILPSALKQQYQNEGNDCYNKL